MVIFRQSQDTGFTLVELVIVLSIIVMMISMVIGTLNPIVLYGRGQDAQRKKDMELIRRMFEEYYNDKRCYPNSTLIGDQVNPGLLLDKNNCGQDIPPFKGRLPCDIYTDSPYLVAVPGGACPQKFTIYTKLISLSDNDITFNWNNTGGYVNQYHGYLNGIQYSGRDVNYGITTQGERWYGLK